MKAEVKRETRVVLTLSSDEFELLRDAVAIARLNIMAERGHAPQAVQAIFKELQFVVVPA